MFRKDESQRDRGSGRHQKDPQVPGIMAGQAFAPETVPQMHLHFTWDPLIIVISSSGG